MTRLLEQISGSDEFKQEYESFEAELSKTAENSALNFNKKRGLAAEIKQFKEQKEEALRYEKLQHEKVPDWIIWLSMLLLFFIA